MSFEGYSKLDLSTQLEYDFVTDCILLVCILLKDLDDQTDPIDRAKLEHGLLKKIARRTTKEYRGEVFSKYVC